MRILLVVAHYFKAEINPSYSSVDEGLRDHRRRTLAATLGAWRTHFSETASLNVVQKMTEVHPASVRLDIVVAVRNDDHLMDEALQRGLGLNLHVANLENPRMLPFEAHQIMAEQASNYDWFVYSEDDLLLHDPLLFRKLAAFNRAFGMGRLLQPQRYEINPQSWRLKTYIDGELRAGLVANLWKFVSATQETLMQTGDLGALHFTRARNPHSGFFALSAEQFAYWKQQPHFLDRDCSFISPLESAATLGLVKTFAVYKPHVPNLDYFEIEHMDRKFSGLRLPIMYRGA